MLIYKALAAAMQLMQPMSMIMLLENMHLKCDINDFSSFSLWHKQAVWGHNQKVMLSRDDRDALVSKEMP